MECIAGILHHFRRANRSFPHGTGKTIIDGAEWGQPTPTVSTDHSEWGMEEILDCCAFADEFWIRTDREIGSEALAAVALNRGDGQRFNGPRKHRAADRDGVPAGFAFQGSA